MSLDFDRLHHPPHADHFLGLTEILAAFPQAKPVALTESIPGMEEQISPGVPAGTGWILPRPVDRRAGGATAAGRHCESVHALGRRLRPARRQNLKADVRDDNDARTTRTGEGGPHQPAQDDRPAYRRAAPDCGAAGTVLRPLFRRGRRPGGLPSAPRLEPGSPRPRRRQLPLGVLRDLVGLDELHLVRLRVRQRRRLVSPADPYRRRRHRVRAPGHRLAFTAADRAVRTPSGRAADHRETPSRVAVAEGRAWEPRANGLRSVGRSPGR
jgi:hypothetical protein